MAGTKGTFYITTPIYYPSDNLHIGHTYCTVMADAMARFKRAQGYDVRFQTGTDEHGQKIQKIALENDMTPIQYVDKIVSGVKKLWDTMEISYDDFVRTTEPRHMERVQKIFMKMYEAGDIYKGRYEGLYCTPCESFWTENQLVDGCCPDCGRPVEKASEEAYFFKLSKYAPALLKNFRENPDFLQPESRRNEMISFIEQGLDDLCISRTSFDWGIPVPLDEKHDQAYVENICAERGIKCTVAVEHCEERAREWGLTSEEAGRRIRYDAFDRAASAYSADHPECPGVKIALAHNMNDQAETVMKPDTRSWRLRCRIPILSIR